MVATAGVVSLALIASSEGFRPSRSWKSSLKISNKNNHYVLHYGIIMTVVIYWTFQSVHFFYKYHLVICWSMAWNYSKKCPLKFKFFCYLCLVTEEKVYTCTLDRQEWRKLPSAEPAECQLEHYEQLCQQTYKKLITSYSWCYSLKYYDNYLITKYLIRRVSLKYLFLSWLISKNSPPSAENKSTTENSKLWQNSLTHKKFPRKSRSRICHKSLKR